MQSGALQLGCSEMRYGVGGRISSHQTWLQPRDLSACTTLISSVTTASLPADEDSLFHQALTSALSVNFEFDGPVGAAATAGAQSAADAEEQNCEASFFTLLDLSPLCSCSLKSNLLLFPRFAERTRRNAFHT